MKKFCFAILIILSSNQAYGAEEGMPQLNPEFWLSQIFWLIFIFVILYLITWKIFLPRITDTIENRKSRIVNDLNEAQKLKENAEIKLKEYNKIIEDSKIEAKKIIDENKRKLDKDIEQKKKKFHEEIEKELANVEKEIASLKKSSEISINKIAIEISSDVIRKIFGAEINKSNVSAIVEDISKNNRVKTQ
tara:strand:- start:522 stop:1094 length:573 start_codon:yes stop_codon:yes gene_type:complete